MADTTEPLTHFPPGFPTLLAAPIALGVTPLAAGRLVLALAALLTWTGLVAFVAEFATLRTAVLIAVAVLCTPAILGVHLSVLSEPPFFSALIAAIGCMWLASRSSRIWPVVWLGLAAGAAIMLRYAGAALVLAAAGWVMVVGRPHLRVPDRLGRVLVAVVPSALTLGAWLLRSVRLEGVHGVRTFGEYGAFGATAHEGIETVVSWVVPVGTGIWRYAIAAPVLIGVGMIARAAWPPVSAHRRFVELLATVGIAYTGFVGVSRLVADPSIPFDERILSPVILLAEIGLGVIIAAWWAKGTSAARWAVGAVLVLWLATSVGVSVSRILVAREDGNDFAGSDWRDSPTIAWVRADTGGAHRVLFTNWPPAVYFQAHRIAHDLPETLDALALHRFRDRLAHSNGVVVGFAELSPDMAPPDSIAALMGLRVVAKLVDGTVWELPEAATGAHLK